MKDKHPFIDFIQSTELSQADKDLIKGVFYGWLKEGDSPGTPSTAPPGSQPAQE